MHHVVMLLELFAASWDSFYACEAHETLYIKAHGFGGYIFQPRENAVYAALIRFKAMSVTSRKLPRK